MLPRHGLHIAVGSPIATIGLAALTFGDGRLAIVGACMFLAAAIELVYAVCDWITWLVWRAALGRKARRAGLSRIPREASTHNAAVLAARMRPDTRAPSAPAETPASDTTAISARSGLAGDGESARLLPLLRVPPNPGRHRCGRMTEGGTS